MLKPYHYELIFREVNGEFIRVNGAPILLSVVLSNYAVVIDDDAQFVRIVRHLDHGKLNFEYRAYNSSKIRININFTPYD